MQIATPLITSFPRSIDILIYAVCFYIWTFTNLKPFPAFQDCIFICATTSNAHARQHYLHRLLVILQNKWNIYGHPFATGNMQRRRQWPHLRTTNDALHILSHPSNFRANCDAQWKMSNCIRLHWIVGRIAGQQQN